MHFVTFSIVIANCDLRDCVKTCLSGVLISEKDIPVTYRSTECLV